jgi:prepilin-type N-terminal cleavage/methylation domain-containing protein
VKLQSAHSQSRGFTLPVLRGQHAFTLIELMVVIGIIVLLTVLVAPAFNSIKGAKDVTNAAFAVKDLVDQARTHALVNNTYVWIGFFEENGTIPSAAPATPGNGRILICTVASKDGTTAYAGSVTSPAKDMDPGGTKLTQIGKMVKLDYTHLRTFSLGAGDGSDTVAGRPTIPGNSPENGQIGDSSPPDSLRYFHYPPTKTEPTAQYVFKKMLQFSPAENVVPKTIITRSDQSSKLAFNLFDRLFWTIPKRV